MDFSDSAVKDGEVVNSLLVSDDGTLIAEDDDGAAQFGVEYATEQCRDLLSNGVEGIHFYCLNKVPSCSAVLKNLALKGHEGTN